MKKKIPILIQFYMFDIRIYHWWDQIKIYWINALQVNFF